MGNGIKPEHIYREVKATEVAPTVTHAEDQATQCVPQSTT